MKKMILSPFYAAIAHLILVGFAPRYGVLPTGLGKRFFGMEPCSIFEGAGGCRFEVEDFVIRELGWRMLLTYEMYFVVLWIICKASATQDKAHLKWLSKEEQLHRFNHLLAICSCFRIIGVCFSVVRYPNIVSEEYFARGLIYALAATLISLYTSLIPSLQCKLPPLIPLSPAWIALTADLMGHVTLLICSLHGVYDDTVLSRSYISVDDPEEITPIVKFCFFLSLVASMVAVVTMSWVRNILTPSQLSYLCGYRALYNILVPLFFWCPENTRFLKVDRLTVYLFRFLLVAIYLHGFIHTKYHPGGDDGNEKESESQISNIKNSKAQTKNI